MRKLCLTLCLVFVLTSLFSVSVFAAAAEYDLNLQVGDTLQPGRYKFNDVIVAGSGHPDTPTGTHALNIKFVSNGVEFSRIEIVYTDVDTFQLLYYEPGSVVPYTVSDGWTYPYNIIDVYEPYTIVVPIRARFLNDNLKLLYRFGEGKSFMAYFSDLVDAASAFIVSSLSTLTTLFFVNGSLTFFGVFSIVALAISISLLLFYILLRFLKLRS